MSNIEKARLDPKRIQMLPRGEKHWNYNQTPSVLTLHRRIHRKHGPAKNHKCVDCGEQALDWSLKFGHEYSDNIDDYESRCRRCHVKYDDKNNNRAELVSQGLKQAYAQGRR